MSTIKTFMRYENKYKLDAKQYLSLRDTILEYMNPDEYGESNGDDFGYSVYNIYYDTKTDEVIQKSLSKPYYKEKLRLRSYDPISGDSEKVFLELKKKIGGIVSKRRMSLTLAQAEEFIVTKKPPEIDSYLGHQVALEISEFLSKYSVVPKTAITYQRTAFFGKSDSSFRITFDKAIASRRENLGLFQDQSEKELLPSDTYLMEVKINGSVPLWLAHAMSRLKIFSTSFSKYGTEYQRYLFSKNYTCSGIIFDPHIFNYTFPKVTASAIQNRKELLYNA